MDEPGKLKLRANASIRISGCKLSQSSKTPVAKHSNKSKRSKFKPNFCKMGLEDFIEGNMWCD